MGTRAHVVAQVAPDAVLAAIFSHTRFSFRIFSNSCTSSHFFFRRLPFGLYGDHEGS
ncbi:unnamed protein product [Amoebophrya sp. A25]|nr:unnamed protein product [Amoebophrya sp. A25]|eukprot:GSA25T00005979001.1